jgi:hypothetical protein
MIPRDYPHLRKFTIIIISPIGRRHGEILIQIGDSIPIIIGIIRIAPEPLLPQIDADFLEGRVSHEDAKAEKSFARRRGGST